MAESSRVHLRSTKFEMAKRSIRKTDPSDTTAPTQRRRTPAIEGETPAVKTTRTRRKAEAADTGASVAAAEAVTQVPAGTNGANGHIESTFDVPHEQIAVRAYHLYLERGSSGDSFHDWVTAERQLREQFERARS
jgi:hypothetical protein